MAGSVAEVVALPAVWLSHALAGIAASLQQPLWVVICSFVAVMAAAGALYGRVFMRAANDRHGGWLFGISYGFLLWMLGPTTALQLLHGSPVLLGGASKGLFAAHLLYGLALGILFPRIQDLVQSKKRGR